MSIERTLSIIKPDGVEKNVIGKILSRFEEAGLRIVAAKMLTLDKTLAGSFYEVHKERPFYDDLVSYMTSGPVFVSVLEGENAVQTNRDLMGATDPKEAAPGTIRADFASSIDANAVHGSDSAENAAKEVAFFLPRPVASCPRSTYWILTEIVLFKKLRNGLGCRHFGLASLCSGFIGIG